MGRGMHLPRAFSSGGGEGEGSFFSTGFSTVVGTRIESMRQTHTSTNHTENYIRVRLILHGAHH